MVETILKFGGVDALSLTEYEKGSNEPDEDPRGREAEIVTGLHLMNAADMLEPSATAPRMLYPDADHPLADADLEEVQEAVEAGDVDLSDLFTSTGRYTPLVNPRRQRRKQSGDLDPGSDRDLWYVPTDSYEAYPPRRVFEPLASIVDEHDDIPNDSVSGEFRARRDGGEVFGEVVFDSADVGHTLDGEPVRMGIEFGWNYFGSRKFYAQPFAQQTTCKNSIRSIGDRETLYHQNKDIDLREWWGGVLTNMFEASSDLADSIHEAMEIVYDFSGQLEDAPDQVNPMPFSVESFYEHAGFPEDACRRAAEYARDEARDSEDPRETAERINAWHLHAGATYWLQWYWTGSEDSRAFRGYRTAADDMLFNPYQMADRVQESYEESERERVMRDVAGHADPAQLTDEEVDEIEDRLAEHEGIAEIRATVNTVQDAVEEFESAEDRLDRIEERLEAAD